MHFPSVIQCDQIAPLVALWSSQRAQRFVICCISPCAITWVSCKPPMDCNKQSIGYLCASRTSLECCGFSNLDTGSFPLAVAHPVWSRFWSFEVIISACAKIWEVSWKPPMDCDTQTIKLSGIVVLFPNFFGKIGPFLPIFWKKIVVLTQDFCGCSWHTADTPPLERLSILRCTFYGVLWFFQSRHRFLLP